MLALAFFNPLPEPGIPDRYLSLRRLNLALPRTFAKLVLQVPLLALVIIAALGCVNSEQKSAPAPNTSPRADVPAYTPTNSSALVGASTPQPGSSPGSAAAPGQIATPQSEALSAREVLEATVAAMKAVHSGRFHLEITTKHESDGTRDLRTLAAGDFQAPDRVRLNMATIHPGRGFEIDVIINGIDTFIGDSSLNRWEAISHSPAPFGHIFEFVGFNAEFEPDVVEGFTLYAQEYLEGRQVYYIKGPIPLDILPELVGSLPVEQAHSEVEFWIGVDDFLVRKSRIFAELALPGKADSARAYNLSSRIVLTLSDYGKPVDIRSPNVQTSPRLRADDHGDSSEIASSLTSGDTLVGTLDNRDDLDYFTFDAKVGRPYEIAATLDTLTEMSVALYAPNGYEISRSEVHEGSPEARIVWVAPTSGSHYIRVTSPGHKTGGYAVSIKQPIGKFTPGKTAVHPNTSSGPGTPASEEVLTSDTVVVSASLENATINVPQSTPPFYFLEILSSLPTNCHAFNGFDVDRSGNEITVAMTNRAPRKWGPGCRFVRSFMTHSLALGDDFNPQDTYTVRVIALPAPGLRSRGPTIPGRVRKDVGEDQITMTFVAQSAPGYPKQTSPDTVALLSYARKMPAVKIDEARPPQHFLMVQSAVLGCGEYDRAEIERKGDDISVLIWNRRAVTGVCSSPGISYVVYRVPLGNDFEPDVPYTVRVNPTHDTPSQDFLGWIGYGKTPGYDTVLVPTQIEQMAFGSGAAGRQHLDLVLHVPNSCSELAGAKIERDGTFVDVAVTDRIPVNAGDKCYPLYDKRESFSLLLGTNFDPGVTYTVRVNDFWTKNGESPPPGTVHLDFVAK